MNTSSPAKSLSWSLIQPYLTFLKEHDAQIAKVIALKDEGGVVNISEVEVYITNLLVQMHETIVNILNENSIVQSESQKSQNKMEVIVREVLRIQETFYQSLSRQSQQQQCNTEAFLKTVNPQLEKSLDSAMTQEIGDLLVSMTSVFDKSFGQLKSHFEEMENNFVQAVKQHLNQEISSLKQQLESKEKQIQELIKSIGDLMSIGKIINNPTDHKECKTDSAQEKLQKDLDAMTAKYDGLKTQYESEFNQFKHQAAQELASLMQRYEAQVQQLNNQLQQDDSKKSSIIPKDEKSNQSFVIPEKAKNTSQDIEEPTFDQSQCLNDPQEKAYFNEIMGNKRFKTKLRYRGSRDGWKYEDFHRMSDSMGPTAALFKIKENENCVGGFTRAQWESHQNNWATDTTSMLFSLTNRQLFQCRSHQKAIMFGKEYGPHFGYGELAAFEPFNGDKKCVSIAQPYGYCIFMDSESKSMLTNLECENEGCEGWSSQFTISELEVWEVIFEQ